MSLARKAFEKAGELTRRVLGTNRGARNKELLEQMARNRRLIPADLRYRKDILLPNPASKAIPTGAVPIKNKIISDLLSPKTLLAGTGIAGALKLSTTDPNDLGREMARMNMTLQQGFDTVRQKAIDIAEMPQIYFMEVEKGYKDEMQRQQEMQNIEEFGSPVEPIALPPEDEGLKPVSIFMANGGPLDMSDNEPRFEDRSPENQMFSIDTAIKNLMTEYQMVVRNNEFQRAQMIADQIDQLQQQKINIQSQNVEQIAPLALPSLPGEPVAPTVAPLPGEPIAPDAPFVLPGEQLVPLASEKLVRTYKDNVGNIFYEMADGSFGNEKEGRMGKEMFFTLFPSAKPTATPVERPSDEISRQLDAIR